MRVHFGFDAGGYAIAGLGDLNGDGHADFVVPQAAGLNGFSGVDRSVIWQIPIAPLYEAMRYVLDNAGDVDGDGQDDLVIGDAGGSQNGQTVGVVRVYSGATRAQLHEWFGPYHQSFFGRLVAGAGDIDADGFADVIVSAFLGSSGTPPRSVDVYSGTSGVRLYRFIDPALSSGFGESIAAAGDTNADGFDDVLIGAGGWPGAAYVYSGFNGSLLRTLSAPAGTNGFGTAVATLGDIDQDGSVDFAVTAIGAHPANPVNASGGIYAFSGNTGGVLWSAPGIWPYYVLGHLLDSLHDIDGDGVRDLLVAAKPVWSPADRFAFVSGRAGTFLGDFHHSGNVIDTANLGDVNGDGFDDVGVNGWPQGPGPLYFGVYLSNASAPMRYCTAKTNSAGCQPYLGFLGDGPSMSVGDDFDVWYGGAVANTNGALVWSTTSANLPFAGGTLCIGSNFKTLAVRSSELNYAQCGGWFHFALRRSYLINHGVGAGTTVYAQVISRDPGFAPPNNFGLTDALAITIAP